MKWEVTCKCGKRSVFDNLEEMLEDDLAITVLSFTHVVTITRIE